MQTLHSVLNVVKPLMQRVLAAALVMLWLLPPMLLLLLLWGIPLLVLSRIVQMLIGKILSLVLS